MREREEKWESERMKSSCLKLSLIESKALKGLSERRFRLAQYNATDNADSEKAFLLGPRGSWFAAPTRYCAMFLSVGNVKKETHSKWVLSVEALFII